MILLLSESERYLSYFSESAKEKLQPKVMKTPFGDVKVAENENVIFIGNMGLNPMGIAWIIQNKKVNAVGMVSKVGGLNKLLKVGDVVMISDYIDNTTCRPKSYFGVVQPELKLRYEMSEPFCLPWQDRVESLLYDYRKERKFNLFDEGVYFCTDGPAFESSAEVNMFRNAGGDVVGHWISPYVYYARELGVNFISVGIVSNIYHKKDEDLLNTEENNSFFGEVYSMLYRTSKNLSDCQTCHIIQRELYS